MMFKTVETMDVTFKNCVVKKVEIKKSPFPDNSFVRITEKGVTYLVNTDYIIFSCFFVAFFLILFVS